MTSRRRPHRLALVLAAGLAATTLASCSTTGNGGDAAKVGDHAISHDDFQELLDDLTELSAVQELLATDESGATLEPKVVTGDFARNRLSAWITTEVLLDDLAARGKPLTQAQRDAAAQRLETSFGDDWAKSSPRLREHLIENFAATEAFVASYTDAGAIEAAYEKGLEGGFVCAAHILVATKSEADAVVTQLRGGADFATVAASSSTDEGSAQSGGVLPDSNGSECMTAEAFQTSLVPEFVAGAEKAEVGVPTEPVQSQFGYHVILLRPYDEVASALVPLAGQTAAQPHFAEVFQAADVTVASRYGAWDDELLDVVALS